MSKVAKKARGVSTEMVLQCNFCRGKGIDFVDKCFCPVCNQKGKVTVKLPVKDCVFCHATGRLEHNSLFTCLVCGGKGVVTIEEPSVNCAFCGGRGIEPGNTNLTCIVCRGKGVLPKMASYTKCSVCKGEAKLKGQSLFCLACKGAGVVSQGFARVLSKT